MNVDLLGDEEVHQRSVLVPIEGPPTVTGAVFRHPSRTLRDGAAQDAGLVPGAVDQMVPHMSSYLEPAPGRDNPSYAGAVVIAGHQGVVVEHAAVGHALGTRGT